MEEEHLQELVRKYVLGSATESEREQLLNWYRNQTSGEYLWPYKTFNQEKKAQERMLRNIQQRIKQQPPKRSILIPIYYKIAAAVVILIGSFLVFQHYLQNTTSPVQAFAEVNTAIGEHKLIRLSDGSAIWLGAKSNLRYPLAFNAKTREIYFTGEAFFEIAKDKKHPFIVHNGKTSTRVLGTSFNITALTNKPVVTVALITGKVAFSDGLNQVKLLPGHEVVYNKVNSEVTLRDIPDLAGVIARRNGDYEYKNVPVGEVVEDVNLNFNTHLTVEGGVKNCPFYGRLKPGETPDVFAKKLAFIENANLTKTKDGYLIKGGGCN